MIDWSDDAIIAAEKAFWGEIYQIEHADWRAALTAAVKVQGLMSPEEMLKNRVIKVKKPRQVDVTVLLSYELGYDEAIDDAVRVIKEYHIPAKHVTSKIFADLRKQEVITLLTNLKKTD
jgi:hypothetical protein